MLDFLGILSNIDANADCNLKHFLNAKIVICHPSSVHSKKPSCKKDRLLKPGWKSHEIKDASWSKWLQLHQCFNFPTLKKWTSLQPFSTLWSSWPSTILQLGCFSGFIHIISPKFFSLYRHSSSYQKQVS